MFSIAAPPRSLSGRSKHISRPCSPIQKSVRAGIISPKGCRSHFHRDYVLYYRFTATEVIIVHVVHGTCKIAAKSNPGVEPSAASQGAVLSSNHEDHP